MDLGTLKWVASSTANCFYATIPAYGSGFNTKMICDRYIFTGIRGTSPYYGDDKTIQAYLRPNVSAVASEIYIHDSAYSDVASFKAAMSGVMLVYELATPATETAEPYVSPQIVDRYGTEEYVTDSIVPVGHETKYTSNISSIRCSLYASGGTTTLLD